MIAEFIPYEQAIALKELGFDEHCFGRYIYDGRGKEWFLVQTQQTKNASVIFEGDISVDGISVASPLYQQTFRWFREKHRLIASVDISEEGTAQEHYFVTITTQGSYGSFETYKEAEHECLIQLIEIVKEKNQ